MADKACHVLRSTARLGLTLALGDKGTFTVDKRFFGLAATEVASGHVDAPLFVKSVALSDGDEKRGRALYIKLRAEELAQEYKRSDRTSAPAPISDEAAVDRGAKALKDVLWILVPALLLAILVAASILK